MSRKMFVVLIACGLLVLGAGFGNHLAEWDKHGENLRRYELTIAGRANYTGEAKAQLIKSRAKMDKVEMLTWGMGVFGGGLIVAGAVGMWGGKRQGKREWD